MENNEVVSEYTFEDGKKHITYMDGTSYSGFTNNDGKPDGKGAIYDKDGNIKYLGQFKNGIRDGQGAEFYNKKDSNMVYYYGQFKGNMREGNGTVHHKDGKTVKGNFIKDKIEGKATILLKDKKRRLEGEFKNGKINGNTRIYRENRLVYEGEYKDGKPNGLGIYRFPDNDSKKYYVGNFNQGVREGSGKILYKNGDIYEGNFKNNLPDQNYSRYQNDNFGLPDAYNGGLNDDQSDEFPMPEKLVEKQFEECRRIHKEVQNKIGRDDSKNEQLNKLWVDIVNKKNCRSYYEMLSLCNKMEKLIHK